MYVYNEQPRNVTSVISVYIHYNTFHYFQMDGLGMTLAFNGY